MARPIWSGILSFGLVSVPVSLYAATEDHTVHFRQIQRGTSDRVRNLRVNERTGEEVAFGDIVKGFETAEGEYVVVEPEELEQISPGRSKTIEITGFVDLDQVKPIFFDKTYYLGPKGKEYGKVYTLLQKALEQANRAGIAMFSMRGKEYLTAVRAENGILTAHTMHFADEVRDPHHEIGNLPDGDTAVSDRELTMAEQLIEMLAVDWNPDDYHDTFEQKVHELIAAKQSGAEYAAPEAAPRPSNVIDLMDILSRSLENAGRPAGAAEPEQAEQAEEAEEAPRSGRTAAGGKGAASRKTAAATRSSGKGAGKKAAAEDLSGLTKAELYKRAGDLDIPHRSTMTRDQLQAALEEAAAAQGDDRRTAKPRRHLRAAS
ncbi:non-homologous end joining protein Ku [Kitasatospora herbaricolor]|uniref:non-homologous end joining protein Ku n=1 Tax=Kitasatospora herbaricolor TaxID=68217 RepID=UPI00174B13C9|nr:Ku protein [Kitasatospora herbaricolor]MDQ0312229.1 DNA end-binding protein Ku [Kitasatospora herbaricolor]GGV14439.1 non-homologous end joining protein Ku [Kitasatospora herbaricolor]